MFISRKSLLLGLITMLAPMGTAVQAQDNGLGFAYLYGYGAANNSGIRSYVPAPPYFALHPPVYYGQRYTRPYGESPFASWPQLRSPSGYQPRPAANYAAPAVVLNLMPAAAPQIVPVPQSYGPAYQSLPASPSTAPAAPAPAAPAPAAPAVPAAPASPVVHVVRPVQPLVIENPYYRAQQEPAHLVANPRN